MTSEHPVTNKEGREKKKKRKDAAACFTSDTRTYQYFDLVMDAGMHAIRSPTAAGSLDINLCCNSPGAWLRSQINHATVWLINPQTGQGKAVYLLCSSELQRSQQTAENRGDKRHNLWRWWLRMGTQLQHNRLKQKLQNVSREDFLLSLQQPHSAHIALRSYCNFLLYGKEKCIKVNTCSSFSHYGDTPTQFRS